MTQTLSKIASKDSIAACPNCGHGNVRAFYAAENIPVHSTIQMRDPQAAKDFPRGRLQLGFCSACGFVFNALYDASVQEYCSNCEESQAFSPTFNAFARSLARRWVDRYDLRGKTVLEIGCGKADFLMLLCQEGIKRGVGVNPSCQPRRIPGEMRDKLELIQDLYGEKYAHLQANVILCRHTLEHIGPTLEFMKSIRRTIGDRKDILVLFELPDVVRVLKERTFWDIYYEHCSYFSPGSLARLFRLAGFDVVELERDYNDQYLLIGARPADSGSSPRLELENDLEEMAALVQADGVRIEQEASRWRDRICDLAAQGKRIVLWGSLSKGVSFLTTLGITDEIEYVVNINPHRQGTFMAGTGHPIVAPKFLAEYRPHYVIVMNPIYCPEIQRDLNVMGIQTQLLPVGME